MTTYFVTRHDGARLWARHHDKLGKLPHTIDAYVSHLDVTILRRGDVVIGTLPLKEIAALQKAGAKFYSLDIDTPQEYRGQELPGTFMKKFGARLTQYRVTSAEPEVIAAGSGSNAASKPDVWIMLISDELAPQLIAYGANPRPHVILVVTEQMKKKAAVLKKLIKANWPKTAVKDQACIAETHATLAAYASKSLDELLLSGYSNIRINLTGGTKPMSLAFAAAASCLKTGVTAVYVDTQRGVLDPVGPGESERLKTVMNLRMSLAAKGLKTNSSSNNTAVFKAQMERRDVHHYLIENNQLVGLLNVIAEQMEFIVGDKKKPKSWKQKEYMPLVRLANPSDERKLGFEIDLGSASKSATARALATGLLGKLFLDNGVLSELPYFKGKVMAMELTSKREIAYLKGGWLEAYVAKVFSQVEIDDWAANVEIDGYSNNEIDLLACNGNQLLFAEVKSSNQTRVDNDNEKVAEKALYKQDSLGTTMGHYFREKWYISLQELDEADKLRAESLRIRVFAGAGERGPMLLSDFPEAVNAWAKRTRLERTPEYKAADIEVSRKWGLDSTSIKEGSMSKLAALKLAISAKK